MTRSHAKWWLAGGGLFILAGYVLSPGPMLRLMDSGLGGGGFENFLQVFYAPLEWLYNHVELVESFYDWWFGMWDV